MRTAEELRASVKALRNRAGLSVRDLASLMEMSSSGYSHYEQRIKEGYLPARIAEKMAAVLGPRGVPAEEVLGLASPSGAPSSLPGVETIRYVDSDDEGSMLVPVFDVSASAGHGSLVEDEPVVDTLAFPPSYLRKLTSSAAGNLAIISVKGESMEPTLLDDDVVLLDRSKVNLSYDGLFVLRFDDALHVKRVGRAPKRGHVTIISDNSGLYPPMMMPVEDVEAVGKVLWYGRKV